MAKVGSAPLRELVNANRAEIKAAVTRHHGRSVAIFGSVARGDEGPCSDAIGTPESLRERIREEVLAEAVRL